MGSLSGVITNSAGGQLSLATVTVVPSDGATLVGSEVRVGGTTVTLASDGSFSVTNIPDGDYRVSIRYYDPVLGAMTTVESVEFPISSGTALSTALGLALLTGPLVQVIGLDIDGHPYYNPDGGMTYSVFLDTDGKPYYGTGAGVDIYEDVDGAPVVLAIP